MERQGRLTQCDLTNVDYFASSQLKQDTFAFVWTLKDFNFRDEREQILSPLFRGGPTTNHTWQLIVHPNGIYREYTENDDDDESFLIKSFSVYLRLNKLGKEFKGGHDTVSASFQTSILDSDNKTIFQKGSPVEFHPFKLMTPSKRQDLVVGRLYEDYERGAFSRKFDVRMNRALVNGELTLHCRIWSQYIVDHVSSSLGLNFEDVKETKSRRPKNRASDTQWETEATSTYATLRHCAEKTEMTFHRTTLRRRHQAPTTN